MSELLAFFLEFLLDVIGGLIGAWFGILEWPDTLPSRIFWGVILVLLGGLLWWELR